MWMLSKGDKKVADTCKEPSFEVLCIYFFNAIFIFKDYFCVGRHCVIFSEFMSYFQMTQSQPDFMSFLF
jgi:hypothetical protein